VALPKTPTSINISSLNIKSLIKTEPAKHAGIYCLVGYPGSCKTTICANLPKVAMVQIGDETGADGMPAHVYKMPGYDELGLNSSDHVFAMLQFFLYEDHKFENIVLDNCSTIQTAFYNDVERDYTGKDDLSEKGKGAGMTKAYWTRVMSFCSQIVKKRNCNVWLLGHPMDYTVNLKNGNYYTKLSLNLPSSPSVGIRQMVLGMCEGAFFIVSDYMTRMDKRGLGAALAANSDHKKMDAIGERRLTILTAERDGIEAKNRSFTMEDSYDIEISENKIDSVTGKNKSIMDFIHAVIGKPANKQQKVKTDE
jgi:hypothetical protein